MRSVRKSFSIITVAFAILWGWCGAAHCQVSPAEITKPNLKHAEQAHFQQLMELNHAISQTRFPFPLILSRYPGLDPKKQPGADKRGIEFIDFNGRVVLKVSADYNAAFSAQALTQNQRADRVFKEAIVPILQLLPKYFSPQPDFDGVGFEIVYHVRTVSSSYSYEGKEVLSIVFNNADAFRLATAAGESEQQEILDNSEVYVGGKPFGLMLGQRDQVVLDEATTEKPSSTPTPAVPAPPSIPASRARSPELAREIPSGLMASKPEAPPSPATPDMRALLMGKAPATQADAEALQTKLQAQLQALDTEGRAHDYFVDYAPPSFAVFRNQIYLQLTLRNPAVFDPNTTSIYKRAARSFDLFLAPRLKGLLAKSPDDAAIAGLDITVLTEFSAKSASSSEALEFICPIGPLRSFTDVDITNQDLIDQSVVLVNGVRIALNLQQVE
jgi:hypothetical protein